MKTVKGNSAKVSVNDLVPSGLMDFFIIKPNVKDNDSKLDDILLDHTVRDFEITILLAKSISLNGQILFDANKKNGTSFIKSNFPENGLVFEDSLGNELHADLNVDKEVSSIHALIKAPKWEIAMLNFDKIAHPILDSMSYLTNSPVLVSRIICLDLKYKVETYSYTVHYQPKYLSFNDNLINKNLIPVFALYREAKNNNSPFYKFLCYYKILEGIYSKIRPSSIHECKKLKFDVNLSNEDVPSYNKIKNTHKKFIGQNIRKVFLSYFKPKYRNLVAHFKIDSGLILNVSDFRSNLEFNDLLILMEICVRKVIDNQIELYKYIEIIKRGVRKSN